MSDHITVSLPSIVTGWIVSVVVLTAMYAEFGHHFWIGFPSAGITLLSVYLSFEEVTDV